MDKFCLSTTWAGYLTTAAVAEQLGVPRGTLLQWVTRGVVPKPARRVGRAFLWNDVEVEQARRILAARQEAGHE